MQTFRKAIRREAMLDFYNLFLALVLFVSPWLFALQNATARLDLWVSGALIAVISLAAIAAYANWEEWDQLASWGMAGGIALGGRVCPYPRHAFQHRYRGGGGISRRP
jgi:hypothetical protein